MDHDCQQRDNLGEALYRRILNGDKEALTELIELYRTGLTLFLFGMLKDEDEAEELTIDVFVALLRNRKRFKGAASFTTYLFSIAKNLALRYLEAQAKHAPLQKTAADLEGVESEYLPEAAILLDERKQRLYAAMERLKSEQREALHLIYFEEMSYASAAAVLQKNERQIEGLVYRAKKSLKLNLESEGWLSENF